MKTKILISYFIFLIFLLVQPVSAIDSTGSAADRKTRDLLDNANRIVTLAAKLRRAYTGQVKSVGKTSFVITGAENDRTITTNDVTSFFRLRAGTKSEINFGSIKIGDDLAAIGTIDPSTSEMTAKQIIAKVRRYNIVGKITAVDKTVISVQELTGPLTKVDLADAISLKSISLSSGQTASIKISSFKTGDTVFVMAYISDPKSDTFSTLKTVQLLP